MNKAEAIAVARQLTIGMAFDTSFEEGCIVTSEPDESLSFSAIDSEGIECTYGVAMVERVYEIPDNEDEIVARYTEIGN